MELQFEPFMEYEGVTVERAKQDKFVYRTNGEIFDITHLETWGWGRTKKGQNDGLHKDVLREAISHNRI